MYDTQASSKSTPALSLLFNLPGPIDVTLVDHAGSPCLIMVLATETIKTRAAVISMREAGSVGELGTLSMFRRRFYDCLQRRADALFEVCEAVLCADGPVGSLVGLSLAAEHRRGHGALYDAVNAGRIQIERLRRELACLPLHRDSQGRIVLAVDVSNWLRPDAATAPDRSFCHVYGRGRNAAQMMRGGRTRSWLRWSPAVAVGPGCWTCCDWGRWTMRPR
jgi:hypothetical protein